MTTNQNQNASNAISFLRARLKGAWVVNSHGPHTDQAARDMLDDHGLVVTYDNVAGSNFSVMEVMG